MDHSQAFEVLGLAKQATRAEAKAAYRALAMRWHPDVNSSPDADARMKTINRAYESVLAHLVLQEQTTAATQPQASGVTNTMAGFSEFDWRAGFASARGAGNPREAPVQRTVQVSLLEAAFGCVKRVRGSTTDDRTLYVRIHPGTCNGTEVAQADIRVLVPTHAMPRPFKLSVQIAKHPLFTLEHDHLAVCLPMSVWRWTLGGAFTVPTLDGTAHINLPPRSSGLMLPNQGWPQFKQPQLRRPLFVSPKRVYPHDLSAQDRRLLQALDAGTRLAEVDGWKHSVRAWAESDYAQGPF